jgi:hypothetical protein
MKHMLDFFFETQTKICKQNSKMLFFSVSYSRDFESFIYQSDEASAYNEISPHVRMYTREIMNTQTVPKNIIVVKFKGYVRNRKFQEDKIELYIDI